MGESSTATTVAIIGAGVTGLAAVKCCLDEGLQPTCFERSDAIGGLWDYRETTAGQTGASVFKSTITNTCKEMMCYSDFPFPKEWPNFLHNTYMKRYCDMYADKFGLRNYIRFSTRLTHLGQAGDYDTSGRWVVTVQHKNDDKETSHEFDAVMICTGILNNPYRPEFPGLHGFKGKVLHTNDYRTPKEFEDKRVVVIGIGNSAVDAATDASRLASQVYLSARRGAWIISRIGDYGYPDEMRFAKRFHMIPNQLVLMSFKNSLKRRYDMITKPLTPSHGLFTCDPIINEDIPGCIMNGSVIVRANPVRFTQTGLEFEDGSYVDDIDYVIMATGYRFKFPFEVDCPALRTKDNRVPLYKLVFPLGLKHNTLSVNGAIASLGAFIPCVELQARWAARAFKGLAKLPSQTEMKAEVKRTDDVMENNFLPYHRHVICMHYEDSIASEIGVRPNFTRLFFTHPLLTLRCLFGPFVPYQYRLVGPGKWDGAGEAIATVWERVLEPTKTRQMETDEKRGTHYKFIIPVSIVVLTIIAARLLI